MCINDSLLPLAWFIREIYIGSVRQIASDYRDGAMRSKAVANIIAIEMFEQKSQEEKYMSFDRPTELPSS